MDLQSRVAAPNVLEFDWLDLACGRGQILLSLERQLSAEKRAKIAYFGLDLNPAYVEETRTTAESLGFRSVQVEVANLSELNWLTVLDHTFNLITFVNAAHEIPAQFLVRLLVHAIMRLADDGAFNIYDIDRLEKAELGAVTWTAQEMKVIVPSIIRSFGAATYRPEIGDWEHRNCGGWSVQLERKHIQFDHGTFRPITAIAAVQETVKELLTGKLDICRKTLGSITSKGARNNDEVEEKIRHLHDFWALTRALSEM
jgi:SAM-dependent methyltransferase